MVVLLLVGWTKTEAIDSLMRKAGYNGTITESLRKKIRLTRYQSTLFTLRYSDYVAYVKTTRGATPSINGVKPGNWLLPYPFIRTISVFRAKHSIPGTHEVEESDLLSLSSEFDLKITWNRLNFQVQVDVCTKLRFLSYARLIIIHCL